MIDAKSWSLAVSILLIGMIILFIIGFFPKSIDAHAETNYYSAELSQIPKLKVGENDAQVFLTTVEGDVINFNFLSSLKRIK